MLLKKHIRILCLLITLLIAFGDSAFAQSYRGDEEQTSDSNTAKKNKKNNRKEDKKKKGRTIEYPLSPLKTRYQIDVLIPLYLDELVVDDKITFKGKLPEKAQSGVNFYEGIKLAVDSLTQLGYKTNVHIHDISSKGSQIEQLIEGDSMASSDLMIGFVPAQQVSALAKYALAKQVNFVSAFSPSDANIKDNPYFILINPTLQTNCQKIATSILKKRVNENLIIYRRSSVAVDSTAYKLMLDSVDFKNFVVVDCDQMPDSASLSKILDTVDNNIILMPIIDALYAEKLVQQLHQTFLNVEFEIYGMPSWKSLTSTKKTVELGEKIAINITQPYFFDATLPLSQAIAAKYKINFGGRPSEMTYRGYEILFWMNALLHKYGTHFNPKMDDNTQSIFTPYNLTQKWDEQNEFHYIENKHLYLSHFQAGTVLMER